MKSTTNDYQIDKYLYLLGSKTSGSVLNLTLRILEVLNGIGYDILKIIQLGIRR